MLIQETMKMKTVLIICIFLGSVIESATSQNSQTDDRKSSDKTTSVTASLSDPGLRIRKVSGLYPLNGFLPASLVFENDYMTLTDTSQISWFDILYSVAIQDASGIKSLQVSKVLLSFRFSYSYPEAWQSLKIMPVYNSYLKYYDLMNRSPWMLNARYINDTFWSTLMRELYQSASHRY